MDDLDRPAVELRDALAARTLSAVALAERCIARTTAAQALNAYVAFDAEAVLAQARAADARLAAGERAPLLGVPVALKDNIDAVGWPAGNGTTALHGQAPLRDAAIVGRLRAAGAVITGKLGMHELALGITSNNAVTGAVRNPWDRQRIPGGSSGGSGAAVAARLVPAAIGTDTGGSVRVPSALCGVCGLRPSAGRIPGDGIAPISATRDTAGPLARSVADLALIDGVLARDASPLPVVAARGLRLGVPGEYFWDDLDDGVRNRALAALDALRGAGVEFVPVALPGLAQANGETSFPLALFELVRDLRRYLHERERGVTLERLFAAIGSADVRALAVPLLGEGAVPEAAYEQALHSRQRLQAIYARAFAGSGVDALVFPTTPCTASRIGEDETVVLNGRAQPTFATFIRNTDPGSNAGIPGLSLPIGLADDGLPVGLALDGPVGGDRRLLAVGAAVEAVLPKMPPAPAHF